MLFLFFTVWADENLERMLYSSPLLEQQKIAENLLEQYVSEGQIGSKVTIHKHKQGTIYEYRYAREGIPLWGQRFSIFIDNSNRVLLRSGYITQGLFKAPLQFLVSPAIATELAVSYVLEQPVSMIDCVSQSVGKQEQRIDCSAPDVNWRTTPRLMKIFWTQEDEIIPAYRMELVGDRTGVSFAQEVIVDASLGDVLSSSSLRVEAEEFYVWADDDGFYPTPFGAYSGIDFVEQSWNDGEWNVFDGKTKSNHVEAYTDRMEPDGFSNGDHYAYAPFNQIFDTEKDPDIDEAQRSVGITQLFFTINQLHSLFLDAGFDEASGIALRTNEGSIGEDNDPMFAEAQDFSGFNNANMMTPADGDSPVMQMYLWLADGGSIEIVSPSSISGTYEVGTSSFGRVEAIEGVVSLADDGQGNSRDGCSPFSTPGEIALVERGSCSFTEKAQYALDGGAVALLVYNDASAGPNDLMSMGGDTPVDIPVFAISRNTGTRLQQEEEPIVSIAIPLFRDSSMDGQIIAHEWSHYMFSRLTLGGQSAQYGALNEGTSDFLALLTGTRFDDVDLEGAFPVGGFSDSDTNRGIRRAPYSTDSDIYPMTFRHIKDGTPLPSFIRGGQPNSQSHQAGEVWCNSLWGALVGLIGEHGVQEGTERMRSYLVMALKMMPEDPSFLEARDAFLGVSAVDVVDYLHFWDAFSQMGMGIDAQAGNKMEEGNQGVQENFSAEGRWVGLEINLSDEGKSCDNDGILDVGELGLITILGQNLGGEELIETQTIEVFDAQGERYTGLEFPSGTEVDIRLGVLEEGSFSLPVQMSDAPPGPLLLRVGDQELRLDLHLDEEENTQFIDGFVHDDDVWEWTCEPDCKAWYRNVEDVLDPVMWGKDLGIGSDSSLISPYVEVREDQDFTLSWSHRFSFEKTEGVAYDGGVVEISIDDGPWTDLDNYVDMPYTDRIIILSTLPHVEPQANAPIADQRAFSGESPGYPEYRDVTLNFGRILAGQQIRIRFRIGTDIAVGATGWFIDTVLFSGVKQAPFTGYVENKEDCVYPIANAGDDQEISSEWTVELNGSESYDPEGSDLTYFWEQTAGPKVTLYQGHTEHPFFFPPNRGKLDFVLYVQNDLGLRTEDTVRIHIEQDNEPNVYVESGCASVGSMPRDGLFWYTIIVVCMLLRRGKQIPSFIDDSYSR